MVKYNDRIWCHFFSIAAVLLFAAGALRAQEATPPSAPAPTPALTAADVEALKAGVAQAQGLDDAMRQQVTALYDEAIAQLKLAEDTRARYAEFDRQREEAPKLTEQIQKELAEPAAEPPPVAESETLASLEPVLTEAETQYKAAQGEFDQWTGEPRRRAERRRQIPELLVAANQRIQETQVQLSEPPAQGEPNELTGARTALLQATLLAAQEEVAALEKEGLYFDAVASLLGLQQEQAQRKLAYAEKMTKALRAAAATRRNDEAEVAAEEARRSLEAIGDIDPRVRDRAAAIAEANAELAERRTSAEGVAGRIETVRAELESMKSLRKRLEEEYEAILDRVESVGLNSAVSAQLQELRRTLPNARDQRQRQRDLNDEIADVELKQSSLAQQQLAIASLEADVEALLKEIAGETTDYERGKLRRSVYDLIQDQRTILDGLTRDYQSYSNVLFELNTELVGLSDQIRTFATYIDENILWSRGLSAFRADMPGEALDAVRGLTDVTSWRRVLDLYIEDLRAHSILYGIGGILLLGILGLHRRMRNELRALGKLAENKKETHFRQTLAALALTLFMSLVWPAVMALIGWRLLVTGDPVDIARAAGSALLACSLFQLVLSLGRHVLDRDGLAKSHFGLDETEVRLLRRNLLFLGALGLPPAFVVFICEFAARDTWRESLGRLAFVLAMLAFALVMGRIAAIVHRVTREKDHGQGVFERRGVRIANYLLVSGLPLLLIGLALSGYYYTALQLVLRLFYTNVLVQAVFLAVLLIRRWLLLTRRRLAIEQARRRREALKAEADSGALEAALEQELDLLRIDAQTQTIVRVGAVLACVLGAWFIWIDVVPALGVLDRFTLWSTTEAVQETVTDDAGNTTTQTIERQVDISAANLGFAILTVILTFVAVRNLPALLEISVLQRMRPGERYATLSIIRYALTGVGGFMALGALGIGWGKLQWLLAALGVGLGFGLQEIFANFISGLILLFERPIRVGDTVTLGTLSGTVSKIRIRATTIIDWDRKELIVPNKEFVTGQIINWNLSDATTRVVIPVGVAYGSDTALVIQTLLQTGQSHPDVLTDPAPQALFLDFGESCLNFELRVYCAELDARLRLTHDLHMAIERNFREAGIEIAFPQREVRIRAIDVAPMLRAVSEPAPLPKVDEHRNGDPRHAKQDERERKP